MPLLSMNAVIAHDLSAKYGERIALSASTFEVPSQSLGAVIGPNGSGKSTLLNLIAGLTKPASGSIEVLGAEPAAARERIAYVLQATTISRTLPISVREVVTMGRYASTGLTRRLGRADRQAIDQALERVDLSNVANESLHELSGGQRQRVLVAQGLAQDHELLLLDEPLIGVDLGSSASIEASLSEDVGRGKTVLVTTHDLGQAMMADWVILLAGMVVAYGSPSAVLTEENLARAYGLRVVRSGDRFVVDDPAHQGADGVHVHLDRSIHLETPGTDLHR
ncbi:MAG TPA: metal ABC transporter ATP-binding protein [Acidimicrobiia bacterium]|nr:metal ABC transporter ATP-binding protein [Acidimicrobiia bacterium]